MTTVSGRKAASCRPQARSHDTSGADGGISRHMLVWTTVDHEKGPQRPHRPARERGVAADRRIRCRPARLRSRERAGDNRVMHSTPVGGVASGVRSHARAARPRIENRLNSAVCSAMRLRAVEPSATTRTGTAAAGDHPRSQASERPILSFRSMPPRRSWISTMTVLISTTTTLRVGGCQAKRSMLPRSP
jgi:hypothetical protein